MDDEYAIAYNAGWNAGAALYRTIAIRHRNTIKRLKAEIEAMRQQHHEDMARAAKVAREREKRRALKQVFGWDTK